MNLKGIERLTDRLRANITAEETNLELFLAAINSLPDKERTFCKYHYIDGKQIEEIEGLMFYSRTMIYNIRKNAIKGLKHYIKTQSGTLGYNDYT